MYRHYGKPNPFTNANVYIIVPLLGETAMQIEGKVDKNAVYLEYNPKTHVLGDSKVLDKTIIWHKSTGC